MVLALLSAGFQSLPPLPTSKVGPSGADSRVGGLVHALGSCGSPMNSPVRLGVSPAAASTPTGVCSQRLEALFPGAGALGCGSVTQSTSCCLASQLQLCPPRSTICLLLGSTSHCLATSPLCLAARLRSSYRLGEFFFFISLVVELPYSSIFCQFWLFLFLSCCPSFGCARRHSVSIYASLAEVLKSFFF